jgi:hypothetical protein
MLKRTKTAYLLVLCLIFNVFSFAAVANDAATDPEISFDQVDGMHTASSLNLSGDSTVPLTSVEISVWNISQPDQWSLLTSSPYLNQVVPYTDSATELTRWSWEHAFSMESIDCTCYIEISLLEQTDLISFGLVAYIGDEHHRPVLKHALGAEMSQMYSTKIFNSNTLELQFNYVLPPSQLQSLESSELIISNVRICPAPFGICSESYTTLDSTDVTLDNLLAIEVDADAQSIQDGYYMLQVQIQDVYLTLSNNITQFVVLDQFKPSVNLTAIDEVSESVPILVDIDVNDGYEGSAYTITWSIIEPDGTPRAVLESEILEDNRLVFKPTKAGVYRVNALVRDIGGHLVTVIHNVSVINIVPIIEIRFDGFLVENGSTITVPSSGNWTFSANTSFDTSNDQDTLEYTWFVDGKTLLSGKSFLASDDLLQANYREIRVQVTDDDGQSSELTFQVLQQDEVKSESNSGSILASTVSLLFVFSIALLVYIRQRKQSESNTGFVKWTERGKGPKN